ncbi:Beclin-1 [Thelohanellus kitauei]|uniref:Beclin-1 n=1 Tax=Thelohanellus kitauei TaxID=669202 RepID=A0A0C2IGP3_THEKT|nr:Beclin-1 [Thelohanellus kitauei]
MLSPHFSSNIFCQQCSAPLNLDKTIRSIDRSSLQELISIIDRCVYLNSGSSNDQLKPCESETTDNDEFLHSESMEDALCLNGTPKLEILQENESSSCEGRFKFINDFFSVLSRITGFKHPLCNDCAISMVSIYETEIQAIHRQIDNMNNYLDDQASLDSTFLSEGFENHGLLADTVDLFDSYYQIYQSYLFSQKISKFYSNPKKSGDEVKIKNSINVSKFNFNKLMSEEQGLIQELENSNKVLNFLNSTHILEIAYDIREKEPGVAMINGCIINYQDFNAALGSLCHLLCVFSHFTGIKYENYRLYPAGNRSLIEIISTSRSLELWDMGSIKMFWDTKFDDAIGAVLACVSQLGKAMSSYQNVFKFPFDIDTDCVYEDRTHTKSYSVRNFRKNMDEWTKAMFLVMIDMKIAMAWLKAME